MRGWLSGFTVLYIFATAGVAFAGQAWTDGTGDGFPDGSILRVYPSEVLTIDLWIDSQSFAYTSYNI